MPECWNIAKQKNGQKIIWIIVQYNFQAYISCQMRAVCFPLTRQAIPHTIIKIWTVAIDLKYLQAVLSQMLSLNHT